MAVGLFVGRFQPLHKGHVKVIEHILGEVDTIVVGVGSSRKHNTQDNPFSFSERRVMVSGALSDYEGRFSVHGIPDFNDDVNWINFIRENLPSFETVYTNAGREASLFSGHRFRIKEAPFYDRGMFSATEVRWRMITGGDWRALVPQSTQDVVDEVNGVARVKKLG